MTRYSARHAVGRTGRRVRTITSTVTTAVMVATFAAFVATPQPASGVTAIPSNYVSVVDSGGANDEVNQADLTQMGRDDTTDTSYYDLFWSWDTTDFTAQAGNACALFDSNGNGRIDLAVCAEIENIPAGNTSDVQQTVRSPQVVTCNDSKADRCAQPGAPVIKPTGITSGDLSGSVSPPANLITDTDPFPAGDQYPNDSTIRIQILKSYLKQLVGGREAVLANVCTYPSLGNTGNNDPKDCVLAPSSGLMKITKIAPSGATQVFTFTVTPGPITKTITGAGSTPNFGLPIGTGYTVAETVPTGWGLDSASCKIGGVTPTGTYDAATHKVTGVTVESGALTECTFTDVATPSLTVAKSNDANHDGTFSDSETVGATASYPYTVTYEATIKNTSLSPATINSITDDKKAAPLSTPVSGRTSCASLIGTELGAGASTTCYFDVTFAAPGDPVTNTVSVTLANSAGSATKTDTSTVTFTKNPELTLDKTADPTSYAKAGDVISYSYKLTNSGNVTLTGPFTVTDDKATVACPATPTSLAPGDSITCGASYTVSQSDVDAGTVKNTAKGHASFGTTPVDSNEDTATVTAAQDMKLTLDKTASPTTYDAVGDVVSYSYELTNSGNVTLSAPFTVTDDKATVTCPATPTSLLPGDSITCGASYTIGQSDLDVGSVKNTATGHGYFGDTAVDSNEDTATVTAAQDAKLTLDKTATPTTYNSVGDVISYSYVLTNSGNVTLVAPFTITDNQVSDEACPATPTSLAPGASITCTASYTITLVDLDAGSVINSATGHGYFGETSVDSNEDTATVAAVPNAELTLVKTAGAATYDSVGDVISYSYVLTNSGNVTLIAPFTVTDDKAGDESCPGTPDSLAPGASITCTASYTISQADLDAGSVTNTAQGHGMFKTTPVDSNYDDETVTASQNPALALDKTAAPATYSAVGDLISYSYVLTNSGNVTLAGPFTVDDNKAAVTCAGTASLAPAASLTCSASYAITQSDLDAGSVVNVAIGHAAFNGTAVDSNQDSATVTALQGAKLTLVKSAEPMTYDSVGDVISYSYELTNSGNVSVSAPFSITDDRAGDEACPATPTSLAPGASIICTASYPITQADLDAGTVTNTAQGHGMFKTAVVDSNYDEETVTAVQSPALSIDKTASPSSYDHVGQVISYGYLVTNSGNVTLFGITVSDDRATVSCPDTSAGLAPLGTITCTASYTITQADLDSGSVTNSAYARSGDTVSPPDSETVTAQKMPALSIDKTASPSSYDHVGQVISYGYLVKNIGNVTLYDITVSDDKATVSCPAEAAVMAPLAEVTCTASYAIGQADLDSGSVTNSAFATDGTTQSNKDSETVTAVQSPALALLKTATPATYDKVGEVISYSYQLTNSGNVTLSGPFTVDDDKATVSCPATASLAPAAFLTCSASYPIAQSDLDAGSVTNVATGHGYFGTTAVDSNEDTETVTAVQSPALSIDKTATPSSYDHVGQVISYSYLVKNSGNVTLFGITVVDDKATVSCPDTSAGLAPGASITCTASYTIGQADLDSGSVTNSAYAKSGSTESNKDSETVTALQSPALALIKTANPATYDQVGDVISYEYLLTNAGNVAVAGPFTVTDDKAIDEACPATPSSLAPAASITCTASYAITQADLDAGSVTNAATGHGFFGASPVDSNEDHATVTADKLPALTIVKTATPSTYSAVGDVIGYSYLVTNAGNVTLFGITVVDDRATVSCPDTSAGLAPGASITCTASYTIGQADLDSGSVTNSAYAKSGNTESPPDSETVTAQKMPALSIDKTATPSTYGAVGDMIGYSYLVTNSGNVTLFGITVVDDRATVSCPDTSAGLAPLGTLTCTASYTITQADLDGGSVKNTAYATDGTVQSTPDSETVTAQKMPALSIDKTAAPSTYGAVGDMIGYSYLVTNSGNVTLFGITVVDDKATVSCPDTSAGLAPGASITCTAGYTITQPDLDSGSVTNTAYATDGTTQSLPDSETVTALQSPALSIDKTATPSSYDHVGQVISYSYLVNNIGNVTLHDITVVDDKATVSCPDTSAGLAPGASITCTAGYTITQPDLDSGSVTNTAYATDGTTQSNEDSETVTALQSPALSIDKTAAPSTYSAVGDVIGYSYLVTNAGNVTLFGITVSDDRATVSCPDTSAGLAPLGTITCTASYTITQADLDSGSVTNSAYARSGDTVSPPDSETVTAVQSPALTLVKTATPSTYDKVGDVISYSYKLTNSGNVTLMAPFTVTDDKATDEACPATPTSLAPAASITCTASYPIAQSDLDAGSVTNVATGHGYFGTAAVNSNEDTETVTAVQNPVLMLTKVDDLNGGTYDHVGQVVGYTLTAKNTGNITLTNVTVWDEPALDGFTCTPTVPVTSLAPGASITCAGTHSITQSDLDAGFFTDIGKADSDQTDEVQARDTIRSTTGQITPTGTTCSQIASGTAADLDAINYTLKGAKIGAVSPGVLFYWVKVSGSGTYTIDQTLSENTLKTPFALAAGSAVWDANCAKVQNAQITYAKNTGDVTVKFTGDGTFYIGIKYDPATVVGKTKPAPPTVTYTFSTAGVSGSGDSIVLTPKNTGQTSTI